MSEYVITNIIPYTEKSFIEVNTCISNLKNITKEYYSMDALCDIETLDLLKRKLLSELEFLAQQFSKIKKYKTQGDYLEEERKQIKAEIMEIIVNNSSVSKTQAEKEVYNHPIYKEKLILLRKLRGYFIKVELLYDHFKNVYNSMSQSLSFIRKEPNYTKNT